MFKAPAFEAALSAVEPEGTRCAANDFCGASFCFQQERGEIQQVE